MKINFLGTGSAFTLKNYQSNFLIQDDVNGLNFLIDCGSDIRFALKGAGLSYKDIDSVYISHLHGDHIGGLEYLGFCTLFDPSCGKIFLHGDGEVLYRGWEKSLSGGMESVQGHVNKLEDYFTVRPISPNGSFDISGDYDIFPIQTVHIMNGYVIIPSFGLMFRASGLTNKIKPSVYFTTDTQYAPHQIMDFYRQADLIIQDCETTPFKSGVHANFFDLCTLPSDIKSKMVLTHYQDNVLAEDGISISQEWIDKCNSNGFNSFATRGQILDVDKWFIDLETLR